MTAQTKAVNKAHFETGDIPTQAHFEDLIDSYADVGYVDPSIDISIAASIATRTRYHVDDYATPQGAIDAAGAAGGGDVLFAPKVYSISAPLTISPSQNFVRLMGSNGTTLHNTSTTTPHIQIGNVTAPYTGGARRGHVENIILTVETAGTSAQNGIEVGPVYDHCILRNVRIGSQSTMRGPGGHGIAVVGGALSVLVLNCTVDFCGGDGFNLNSSEAGGGNISLIENSSFRQCTGNGLRIQATGSGGGYHLRIESNTFESNTGAAFIINGGALVMVSNCHTESNGVVSEVSSGNVHIFNTALGLDRGLEISSNSCVTIERCYFSDAANLNITAPYAGILVRDCLLETMTGSIVDATAAAIIEGCRTYSGNFDVSFARVPHMRPAIVPSATAAMRGWMFRVSVDDSAPDQLYATRKGWLYPGTYQHVPLLPIVHAVSGYPVTDADFSITPPDGAWGMNTGDKILYFRMGGTWMTVAAEIPSGSMTGTSAGAATQSGTLT